MLFQLTFLRTPLQMTFFLNRSRYFFVNPLHHITEDTLLFHHQSVDLFRRQYPPS